MKYLDRKANLQMANLTPHPQEARPTDTAEVLRAVRRIARALALASRELAKRHSLTVPQLLCLRLLKDAVALSAGSIAAALSLSPQTVTGLLDRLEERGLVRRARSEADRRQVLVSLTSRGEEIVASEAPTLQDRFVARLNYLSPARRRALRRALATVVRLLEADTLDAAPLLAYGHSLDPSADTRDEPAASTSLSHTALGLRGANASR